VDYELLVFRNGVPEIFVFLAYDAVSLCSCIERWGIYCPLTWRHITEERQPKPGGTLVLLLLLVLTTTMMTDKMFQSCVLEFFFAAVCESTV
jgi:hypothetical protein